MSALAGAAALTAGLVAVLAPAANAADPVDTSNQIADGDFSTPPVSGTFTTFGAGSSIGPWSVDSGNIDLVSKNLWQLPPGDPDTTQTIDLNGTGAGSISQPVTLVPHTTYRLSFNYAGNPGAAGVKTGWVKVTSSTGSDAVQINFDTTGHSTSDMGWQHDSGTFLNVGGTDATLSAYSTTPGAFGPVVTDFSLTVVPPPVITPVANIDVFQATPAGTAVNYTLPTATDPNNGDASLPVTCTPPPGTVFPVGTTTVTCSTQATTAPRLRASESFTVTVHPVVGVCRGTPLEVGVAVLRLAPGTANPASTPCATDAKRVLNTNIVITPAIPLLHIPGNSISIGALTGTTTNDAANGSMSAYAQVPDVKISLLGHTLEITALTSNASSTLTSCSAPATVVGHSTFATFAIDGVIAPTQHTDKPVTLQVPGLGTVAFNQHNAIGNLITQDAFHLNVAGLVDIALGQAIAGATCGS